MGTIHGLHHVNTCNRPQHPLHFLQRDFYLPRPDTFFSSMRQRAVVQPLQWNAAALLLLFGLCLGHS